MTAKIHHFALFHSTLPSISLVVVFPGYELGSEALNMFKCVAFLIYSTVWLSLFNYNILVEDILLYQYGMLWMLQFEVITRYRCVLLQLFFKMKTF